MELRIKIMQKQAIPRGEKKTFTVNFIDRKTWLICFFVCLFVPFASFCFSSPILNKITIFSDYLE